MTAYKIRTRLLALAATTAVAIAACGGAATTSAPGGGGATQPAGATQSTGGGVPTQQPGGGQTVDACSLLTAEDIKAVTGYAIDKAVPGPQGGVFASGCEWGLIAENEIIPPSIVLGIMTTGGKAFYDQFFAPFENADGNKPISGLGDKAIDVGASTVQVIKGDAFFNLQYLGKQDLEEELAKKVLTHL